MSSLKTGEPIAALLGRLARPVGPGEFDDVRLRMVDRLIEAKDGDSVVAHESWMAAWEEAIDTLTERVLATANAQLESAARYSRFPARSLAEALPTDAERQALRNRLSSRGIALERSAPLGIDPTGSRVRAGRLEAAWEAAVALARSEESSWRGRAATIRQWRRPWRPLVVAASLLLATALLAALWVGGLLPAPAWFAPVTNWFWGLPWR